MHTTRRHFLGNLGFGASAYALRSLVTGLPASLLCSPKKALANALKADSTSALTNPQFVIFASSDQGDPVNCNAPGTYNDPNASHPLTPLFAATKLNLGALSTTAAQTWTQLSATTLARTCFFHHATYTGIHADEPLIMALGGFSKTRDNLISAVATNLQTSLKTIQPAPMALSFSSLSYQGQPVSSIPPSSLGTIYQATSLGSAEVVRLRDDTLDKLNAWLKTNATPAQKSFVDDYVRTQQEARAVPTNLLAALSAIDTNTVQDQVKAAILLFQMRMTPAVAIKIPFGGDNHSDPSLSNEAADYDGNSPASTSSVLLGGKTGVASLADMQQQLAQAGMQDQVTFAMLNVFGRTQGAKSREGRSHNGNHHVSVMIGSNVKGSVVGGVTPLGPTDNFASALAIDPVSGQGSTSASIPYAETMSAFGKTFVRAAGLTEATASDLVLGGQTVTAALR